MAGTCGRGAAGGGGGGPRPSTGIPKLRAGSVTGPFRVAVGARSEELEGMRCRGVRCVVSVGVVGGDASWIVWVALVCGGVGKAVISMGSGFRACIGVESLYKWR